VGVRGRDVATIGKTRGRRERRWRMVNGREEERRGFI